MKSALRSALDQAKGVSEHIITVVSDIRGFTPFSVARDSADTAVYIRRIYIQMIDQFFPGGHFYKPTGDGLLIVFRYSEEDLERVASDVLIGCLRCHEEFGKLCEGYKMINFDVPQSMGFGVARGPACCLVSDQQVLDYSGRLLNLTSRLMDIARPSGIVIDGDFGDDLIPSDYRLQFANKDVYLRSIADETPIRVLYLDGSVEIPEWALSPLREPKWATFEERFTIQKLRQLAPIFTKFLIKPPKLPQEIQANLVYPAKSGGSYLKGYTQKAKCETKVISEGGEHRLWFDVSKALEFLKKIKVGERQVVTLRARYVTSRGSVMTKGD